MFADLGRKSFTGMRNPAIYASVLLGVSLLYVGWILSSRWQENRQIEERATEKKRAEDKHTVEMMGSDRFEILNFYARPRVIRRGQTTQLCYAVSNTKTVRLEPQSSPVWPSYARCVNVSPTRDTTYTLTAESAKGEIKTATTVVQVR
jgi:hypothetical protein